MNSKEGYCVFHGLCIDNISNSNLTEVKKYCVVVKSLIKTIELKDCGYCRKIVSKVIHSAKQHLVIPKLILCLCTPEFGEHSKICVLKNSHMIIVLS